MSDIWLLKSKRIVETESSSPTSDDIFSDDELSRINKKASEAFEYLEELVNKNEKYGVCALNCALNTKEQIKHQKKVNNRLQSLVDDFNETFYTTLYDVKTPLETGIYADYSPLVHGLKHDVMEELKSSTYFDRFTDGDYSNNNLAECVTNILDKFSELKTGSDENDSINNFVDHVEIFIQNNVTPITDDITTTFQQIVDTYRNLEVYNEEYSELYVSESYITDTNRITTMLDTLDSFNAVLKQDITLDDDSTVSLKYLISNKFGIDTSIAVGNLRFEIEEADSYLTTFKYEDLEFSQNVMTSVNSSIELVEEKHKSVTAQYNELININFSTSDDINTRLKELDNNLTDIYLNNDEIYVTTEQAEKLNLTEKQEVKVEDELLNYDKSKIDAIFEDGYVTASEEQQLRQLILNNKDYYLKKVYDFNNPEDKLIALLLYDILCEEKFREKYGDTFYNSEHFTTSTLASIVYDSAQFKMSRGSGLIGTTNFVDIWNYYLGKNGEETPEYEFLRGLYDGFTKKSSSSSLKDDTHMFSALATLYGLDAFGLQSGINIASNSTLDHSGGWLLDFGTDFEVGKSSSTSKDFSVSQEDLEADYSAMKIYSDTNEGMSMWSSFYNNEKSINDNPIDGVGYDNSDGNAKSREFFDRSINEGLLTKEEILDSYCDYRKSLVDMVKPIKDNGFEKFLEDYFNVEIMGIGGIELWV